MQTDWWKSDGIKLPTGIHSLKELSFFCENHSDWVDEAVKEGQGREVLSGNSRAPEALIGASLSHLEKWISQGGGLTSSRKGREKSPTTEPLREVLPRMHSIRSLLWLVLRSLFEGKKSGRRWGGMATTELTFDNKSFSFSDDSHKADSAEYADPEIKKMGAQLQTFSVECLVYVFQRYGNKTGEEKYKPCESKKITEAVEREVCTGCRGNTVVALPHGEPTDDAVRYYLLAEEIRGLSLWLLNAVLLFFDAKSINFNTLLSFLFPFLSKEGIDVTTGWSGEKKKESGSLFHPLFGPLLFGSSLWVYSGATQCLHTLLLLLRPSLQYAAEPSGGKPFESSSSPNLTVQGGNILLLLHYVMVHGVLEATESIHSSGSPTKKSRKGSLINLTAVPQWLHLLSVLVSVTNYQKFPQSLSYLNTLLARSHVLFGSLWRENSVKGSPVTSESLGSSWRNEPLSFFTVLYDAWLTPSTLLGIDTAPSTPSYRITRLNTNLIRYHTNLMGVSVITLYSHLFSNESLFDFIMRYNTNLTTYYEQKGLENTLAKRPEAFPSSCQPFEVPLESLFAHSVAREGFWRLLSSISKSYPQIIQSLFDTHVLPSAKELVTEVQKDFVQRDMQHIVLEFDEDSSLHKSSTEDEDMETVLSSEDGAPGNTTREEVKKRLLERLLSVLWEKEGGTIRYRWSSCISEALKMFLRFIDFVWESFDSNYDDKARENKAIEMFRASKTEKESIFKWILLPLVRLILESLQHHSVNAIVRYRDMYLYLLRCIANLGNSFVEELTQGDRDCMFDVVEKSCILLNILTPVNIDAVSTLKSSLEQIEAEAFSTIGLFSWKYPIYEAQYGLRMFSLLTDGLLQDQIESLTPGSIVKAKTAFALANLLSNLPVQPASGSSHHLLIIRSSPDSIRLLCSVAVYCTYMINKFLKLSNPSLLEEDVVNYKVVQSQGIRMISYLLSVLTFEELIEELDLSFIYECFIPAQGKGQPRGNYYFRAPQLNESECVGEGLLKCLLDLSKTQYVNNNSFNVQWVKKGDGKVRWNAVRAMGVALGEGTFPDGERRPSNFSTLVEAEPNYTIECLLLLSELVLNDKLFKVRTQAAIAIGSIVVPLQDFLSANKEKRKAGQHAIALTDQSGKELDVMALFLRQTCGSLQTIDQTHNFYQFKEQQTLSVALVQCIRTICETVKPTVEVEKTFSEFKGLLEQHELV